MPDEKTIVASKGPQDSTVPTVQYRGLYRFERIPACVVSVADMRRLYFELSEKTQEALERQLATYQKPPGTTAEEFEAFKEKVRKVGGLTVMVFGGHGEQLLSNETNPFEEDILPDVINSIVFDSSESLKSQDVTVLNRFRLLLDFTEPPSFNAYDPWSQPTPNKSSI